MKVSQEKIQELEKELEDLENKLLPEVQSELKNAVDSGDGEHDNTLIQMAQARMKQLMDKMSEIKRILKSHQLIEKRNDGIIGLGNYVELEDEFGQTKSVTIVGDLEVDPRRKMISEKSPLGLTLLGKKIGDIFDFNNTITTTKYKIILVR